MKDYKPYIYHILEAIESIESFTQNCSKASFCEDRMRYDAVLRNLQTLAESVKRLPETIYDIYPQIPWRQIIGFRNILVHDYLDGIDSTVIWSIVTGELHPLKSAMLQECPDWEKIKQNH